MAIVKSTIPKLEDKCPPVLDILSTKNSLISFANISNCLLSKFFKNLGSLISLFVSPILISFVNCIVYS